MMSIYIGLRRICTISALVSLVFLLAVVASNIVARSIFNVTDGSINFIIQGAIELSSYALLILVFGSFPNAIPTGLVQVDFLLDVLPKPIRNFLKWIWAILLLVGTATLAWLFIKSGFTAHQRGSLTQDLEIPLWIFYSVISAQCMCLAVISLFNLLNAFGLTQLNEFDGETPL